MTDATAQHSKASVSGSEASSSSLRDARPAIDAATRPAVLGLFFSAIFWLVVSTFLSAASSIKLQFPEFLNWSFLSYGRITPVAEATFVFGWCSMAAAGVSIWVISRLSGRLAIGKGLAVLGIAIWNLGLTIGALSALVGILRPLNGLDLPASSYILVYFGFAMVAVWIVLSFRSNGEQVPIASMFIMGGVCWFLWSFLAGNVLISFPKLTEAMGQLTGSMEQIVAAWTFHGAVWLWLVPAALGAAYFVVPKATGKPIFSGALGRGCFWMYFAVAGLTAMTRLSGGPIPLWLVSISAAASILLLVPIIGSAFNLNESVRGSDRASVSPSLSFTRFGLVTFVVVGATFAFSSLRSVDYAVHFTLFQSGLQTLLLQGFVSMGLFGAIYYIMPRLSGCEWISSSLIKIHFLGAAYGSAMAGSMLIFSGLMSGADLANGEATFNSVMESSAFFYFGRTLSFALLGISYAAFILHFLLMACRIGQPEGEPTLINSSHGH